MTWYCYSFLVKAAEFCSDYDLKVADNEVHFTRGKRADITIPAKPLPQMSAHLVLSLNNKSLGEVSC